jgi:hypothetical protein
MPHFSPAILLGLRRQSFLRWAEAVTPPLGHCLVCRDRKRAFSRFRPAPWPKLSVKIPVEWSGSRRAGYTALLQYLTNLLTEAAGGERLL